VEVNGSLAALWSSGEEFTGMVSATDLGDGTERVVVRDRSTPGATPVRFLRLRVTK